VPGTTRRLHLVWGVRAVDTVVPSGADPMRAALERARSELPKGSRVILFDLAGTDDAPSAVNTITL
jgi:hypothetical protein